MKNYEFNIVLRETSEIGDDAARLFAAGCDDATPVSRGGIAWLHVDREAAGLEDAIRWAIAQVRAAGFLIAKVELDADSAVFVDIRR